MAAGSNGVLEFYFLSRQISLLVRTLHIKPSGSVNFRNARLVKNNQVVYFIADVLINNVI